MRKHPLIFVIVASCAVYTLGSAQEPPQDIDAVELAENLTFADAQGKPVRVPAGRFVVTLTDDDRLQLTPAVEGDIVDLDTDMDEHDQDIDEAVALLVEAEGDSVQQLLLLLPDGRIAKAIGSSGGALPRGVYPPTARELQAAVATKAELTLAYRIRSQLNVQRQSVRPTPAALTISAVNVSMPNPSSCTYRWSASVTNGTSEATGPLGAQAYQGAQGSSWSPASGFSVASIAPGAEFTTGSITFARAANTTRLNVRLFQDGNVLAQRIVALPAPPMAPIAFASNVTATSYTYEVTNLNVQGLPDVIVQAYSSASSSGPWSGAGGRVVPCLNGNETFSRTRDKPPESAYIRVDVRFTGSPAVIATNVFSIAP